MVLAECTVCGGCGAWCCLGIIVTRHLPRSFRVFLNRFCRVYGKDHTVFSAVRARVASMKSLRLAGVM